MINRENCFGTQLPEKKCGKCPYKEACEFAYNDTKASEKADRAWNEHVALSNFAELYAVADERTAEEELPEEKVYTRSQMVSAIAFVLRLKCNPRLTELLAKVYSAGANLTELAKDAGISRQGMRKRVKTELERMFNINSRSGGKGRDNAI